jgi:hypothetical protein
VSELAALTTSELILVTPTDTAPADWTFDVYVGATPEGMTKQNLSPVEAGQTWAMAPGGILTGAGLPAGQRPEFFLRRERLWQRG